MKKEHKRGIYLFEFDKIFFKFVERKKNGRRDLQPEAKLFPTVRPVNLPPNGFCVFCKELKPPEGLPE